MKSCELLIEEQTPLAIPSKELAETEDSDDTLEEQSEAEQASINDKAEDEIEETTRWSSVSPTKMGRHMTSLEIETPNTTIISPSRFSVLAETEEPDERNEVEKCVEREEGELIGQEEVVKEKKEING